MDSKIRFILPFKVNRHLACAPLITHQHLGEQGLTQITIFLSDENNVYLTSQAVTQYVGYVYSNNHSRDFD